MFASRPGAKTFGKLGNRAGARLVLAIDATFSLPERRATARVDNISRHGCRLTLDAPPRPGATILLRVERAESFGRIIWARGQSCGVRFAEPLDMRTLARLRWIAENPAAHERNSIGSAGQIWR